MYAASIRNNVIHRNEILTGDSGSVDPNTGPYCSHASVLYYRQSLDRIDRARVMSLIVAGSDGRSAK